jgi:PTS system nitrogen regulatory IIA component
MRISELLHPQVVLPAVTPQRKEDVLTLVAARLSGCYPELDRDRLTAALLMRERLMGTALADGVAIPHARLRNVARTVAAFGRSPAGIDWESHDGRPTHLFFVLVVPDDAQSAHLKVLAAASRLLHDPACRTRLMQASDDMLLQALRAEEERALDPRTVRPSPRLVMT